MCRNCAVTHGSGRVRGFTLNLFIAGPSDDDDAAAMFPLRACCSRVLLLCTFSGSCICICAVIGGDSSASGSDWASAASSTVMTRAEKVWQEQIRRRYPVNEKPAETSCKQHRSETCDFKAPLVPDGWWSVYHFLFFSPFSFFFVAEYDSEGKLDFFSGEKKMTSGCSFLFP